MRNSKPLCELALSVINTEIAAIESLRERIDERFAKACELLMQVSGRIIVIGMGKSGHIGNKLAATLASTGSPAFFVHPGEASHGDMGMITDKDVIILLSNSGTTPEIVPLLPLIQRLNCPIIALVGQLDSPIARAATVALDVGVDKEACPLDLAPTASTTVALVLGDALAIALLEARGFTAEDFARSHPGGRLGKRLILTVNDLMHTGDAIPQLMLPSTLYQALLEMTKKHFGMTTIVDENNRLQGIFTDGDLRRAFENNADIQRTSLGEVMTTIPKTITADALAVSALKLMEDNTISTLVVIDKDECVIGILAMYDLLKAGVA